MPRYPHRAAYYPYTHPLQHAYATGHTSLWYTPALPKHFVAIAPEGIWLLPASLLGGPPQRLWAAARTYTANHELLRAQPPALERLYAQPPADWEPPTRHTPLHSELPAHP